LKRLDLVTLPLRTGVLLFLLGAAYYYGYGTPHEEWRKESPETGVVARYSRNGRPWRTFYDRDQNRRWDMWIDERAGRPYIVSIDEDGDGEPDREQDEWGSPLSAGRAAKLRAHKTLVEFLHNPRQLAYSGLAILLYGTLEFIIRSWALA
jgi:hypothetical protein